MFGEGRPKLGGHERGMGCHSNYPNVKSIELTLSRVRAPLMLPTPREAPEKCASVAARLRLRETACHRRKMEFEAAETARSTPSRHQKSLGLLTTKFVSLLQEAKDGVLDLKVVSGAARRRVGLSF